MRVPKEIKEYTSPRWNPFDAKADTRATKRAWGYVAQWIKDMVRIEPKVMGEVARARFGDLSNWLERGPGNVGACGCLVGTCAIKLVQDRNSVTLHKSVDSYSIPYFQSPSGLELEADEVVRRLAFRTAMKVSANKAGLAASAVGQSLGNALAVKLIKQEILRHLAIRAARSRASKKAWAARV